MMPDNSSTQMKRRDPGKDLMKRGIVLYLSLDEWIALRKAVLDDKTSVPKLATQWARDYLAATAERKKQPK